MDREGVEGFFDAFLFITILSVASCIIFASIPMVLRMENHKIRDAAIGYSASSLDAILSSTIPNASYVGRDGRTVKFENGSTVEEFLLDETYLLLSDWPRTSFDECNRIIEKMARQLITPAYKFTIRTNVVGDGDSRSVMTIGEGVATVGYTASRDYFVHGMTIEIALVLWWV